jgi:hypothetical protein
MRVYCNVVLPDGMGFGFCNPHLQEERLRIQLSEEAKRTDGAAPA